MQLKKVLDNTLSGVYSTFFQNAVQIVSQLLLVPIILKQSGQELMGTYAIVNQIISLTILFDFGFSVALQRYLSGLNNNGKADSEFVSLLNRAKYILVLINFFIGFLIFVFSNYIDLVFDLSLKNLKDAEISLLIYSFYFFIKPFFSVYSTALNSIQKMGVVNNVVTIVNVVKIPVSIILLHLEYGLFGIITSSLILDLFGFLMMRYFFYKSIWNDKQKYISATEKKKVSVTEVFKFGLSYWGVNLSGVLLLSSDSLILGGLYGAKVVSVYFTSKIFSSLFVSLITRVLDNLYSSLVYLISNNNIVLVNTIVFKFIKYLLFIICFIILGFILFVNTVIDLWVGEQQVSSNLLILLIAIFSVSQIINHLLSIFILSFGNLKNWNLFSGISSLIGILVSYFFAKHFGFEYVLLGYIFSFFFQIIFLLKRLSEFIDLSISRFYIEISLLIIILSVSFSFVSFQPINLGLNKMIILFPFYFVVFNFLLFRYILLEEDRIYIRKFLMRFK